MTYEWKNEELGHKNHGLFKTSYNHLPTCTDENHEQPLSKSNQWHVTYQAGLLTTPLHDIHTLAIISNIFEVIECVCVCVCVCVVTYPISNFQPDDRFS